MQVTKDSWGISMQKTIKNKCMLGLTALLVWKKKKERKEIKAKCMLRLIVSLVTLLYEENKSSFFIMKRKRKGSKCIIFLGGERMSTWGRKRNAWSEREAETNTCAYTTCSSFSGVCMVFLVVHNVALMFPCYIGGWPHLSCTWCMS